MMPGNLNICLLYSMVPIPAVEIWEMRKSLNLFVLVYIKVFIFLWICKIGIYKGDHELENKKNLRSSILKKNVSELLSILGEIKYGSITMVIQDGKLVQIETKEKIRLV
jgi:hypothetical protein